MFKKMTMLKIRILQLSLEKMVHLMLQQSKWMKATVDMLDATGKNKLVGVLSPKADNLTGVTCDLLESLLDGKKWCYYH